MSFNDEYDELVFQCKKVHVFKIPPRSSAEGYKAEAWLNNHIWTGRLKIVATGLKLAIKLEHTDTGKIFATCIVNTDKNGPQSIESVSDSSRYFVLRIENQGKHAFIGIGFEERTEAFDFNIAVQNHLKFVELQNAPAPDFSQDAKVDYSMKQGEKITVNIKVKTKAGVKQSVGTATNNSKPASDDSGFGGLLLPPPPTAGKKPATTTASKTNKSNATALDSLLDL